MTITLGEEASPLPILTTDIVLRRIFTRNELDALRTKESQRLDALISESVAKFRVRKVLHRLKARLEFTLKNKAEGRKRHMSTAVLTKPACDAAGKTMVGIEGVLLSNDRHGKVDLRCNGVTCIWVYDHSPETETHQVSSRSF